MLKRELVAELKMFARFPSMAAEYPDRLQDLLTEAVEALEPSSVQIPGQLTML